MGFYLKFFLCLFPLALFCNPAVPHMDVEKTHILFLLKKGQVKNAVEAYEKRKNSIGKHDSETLEQMSLILLEQAARSEVEEERLLSLYAMQLCGISSLNHLLGLGIASTNPMVQTATIHLLSQIQEDFSEDVIFQAMHSPYLGIRMEAAFYLAQKKHPSAIGQIESLMYKLPKPFWVFFPELFAQIGTADAIHLVKKLMMDSDLPIRISSILSAAKYGRDDLLGSIRAISTHLDLAEQEATALALGFLKDLKSEKRLKELTLSPDSNVKLSAAQSLYMMGFTDSRTVIENLAGKEGNLFAIHILGNIPESKDVLAKCLSSIDQNARINAALSLLKLRDPRCFPSLYEILLRDEKDLGLIPHYSPGHALMHWKVIPSTRQFESLTKTDLHAISISMREQILVDAIELSEALFLDIARDIFYAKQYELIPLLVSLLENLNSEAALKFLKSRSQEAGAPLIRGYANLALFRMRSGGENEQAFLAWITREKGEQAITFRPTPPWSVKEIKRNEYFLTPEEKSRLLIESYLALASRHDAIGINTLLSAIKEGNPKNYGLLAGLLLKAIQ